MWGAQSRQPPAFSRLDLLESRSAARIAAPPELDKEEPPGEPPALPNRSIY
jgi:hypothetical protein